MNLGEKLTDGAVRDFFPAEFFGPDPEPEIIRIDPGAWGVGSASDAPSEMIIPPDENP